MNKVCITGRIANDLDMRNTITGKNVMDITLAVNDGKNATSFVPVTVWEGSAKYLSDYAKKGTKIEVTGRIKVDSYEQDGQKRKKVYVTAENVEILAQPQEKKGESNSLDIQPEELPFY